MVIRKTCSTQEHTPMEAVLSSAGGGRGGVARKLHDSACLRVRFGARRAAGLETRCRRGRLPHKSEGEADDYGQLVPALLCRPGVEQIGEPAGVAHFGRYPDSELVLHAEAGDSRGAERG